MVKFINNYSHRRRKRLSKWTILSYVSIASVFFTLLFRIEVSSFCLQPRRASTPSSSSSSSSYSMLYSFRSDSEQIRASCGDKLASNNNNNNLNGDNKAAQVSRRTILLDSSKASIVAAAIIGTASAVLPSWLDSNKALAQAATVGSPQPSVGTVAVIGAGGRTGSLCVNACLRRGIPVKALTRTGEFMSPPTPPGAVTMYDGDMSKLLAIDRCDVSDLSLSSSMNALTKTLEGCSAVIYAASASKKGGTAKLVDNEGVVRVAEAAVIYAASASKKGGTAKLVDNEGVVRVAEAAVAANVPRYVVISSTATTRPKSLGYVFTNLGVGGNIMGEKRSGEVGTIDAYKSNNNGKCSYTIIRPGGLEEPKRNSVLGLSKLEISQGDVFSGIISRADVAEITVELAMSGAANVKNTAVELYYTDSLVEVEGKFKKLLTAAKIEGSPESRLRLHGTTYPDLLAGIRPNIDYFIEQ